MNSPVPDKTNLTLNAISHLALSLPGSALLALIYSAVVESNGDQATARGYLIDGIRNAGAYFGDKSNPIIEEKVGAAILLLMAVMIFDEVAAHLVPDPNQGPSAN